MVKEGILLLEDKRYSDRPRMRINYYQFPTNMQKDSGGGE